MESCCNCDICNWKEPKKTIRFLIILNLFHLWYLYFKPSFFSLLIQSIFYHTLMAMICKKFNIELPKVFCHKKCGENLDIKKETEQCYKKTYDNVNKILDKLRDMILLTDIKSLIILVAVCLVITSFFSHFTSVTIIVLAINLCILLGYIKSHKSITDKIENTIEKVKHIIENKIPKYKAD